MTRSTTALRQRRQRRGVRTGTQDGVALGLDRVHGPRHGASTSAAYQRICSRSRTTSPMTVTTGRRQVRGLDVGCEVCEVADHDLLRRPSCRGRWTRPGCSGRAPYRIRVEQTSASVGQAHQDDQRAGALGVRPPAHLRRRVVGVEMAGEHGDVVGDAAVGHRDAGVGGHGDGAADAGDDVERDARPRRRPAPPRRRGRTRTGHRP